MNNIQTSNIILKILSEIKSVLLRIDEKQVDNFVKGILTSKKVVCCGSGRVGLVAKGFSMRLAQLGLNSFAIGDSNLSNLTGDDLLVICSGSGETQTIFDIAYLAHLKGINIALITGNKNSRMGKISNIIVHIFAPSKIDLDRNVKTLQPMTTLNEQCLAIFFDSIILQLMRITGETHETMQGRHSILE